MSAMTVPAEHLDRPFDPSPFKCERCGGQGSIEDTPVPGYFSE